MNSSNILKITNQVYRVCISQKCMPPTRLLHKQNSSMSINVVTKSNEKENFQDVLPCIIGSLKTTEKLAEVPEVTNWLKKVLEYNLAGGKKNRGLATIFAYEMLERPENINDETMRLARIMGWCVEMLQAYFLVADDIMDGSSTRRGVPCWYQLPDVGMEAVNDSILIQASIFQTLKTYFGNTSQYVDIVNLFNEIILLTSAGQYLDFSMAHRNKNDYSLFTIDRYNAIVKYKTAYYTFKLPVCLGMLLAHITDKEIITRAEEITLEIGQLFQMQDDFIDCYSDESVSGKAGTDIQEGKCSWLAVTALQRCNPAQRQTFEQFYASKEPEHVKRIKQLYEQLELSKIYRDLERTKYNEIVQKIQKLSQESNMSPKLFLRLLDMIYNRKQ